MELYSFAICFVQVGDFGILVRSGFSVSKALFFNFLSALVALAGTALVLLHLFFFSPFKPVTGQNETDIQKFIIIFSSCTRLCYGDKSQDSRRL